MNECEHKWLMRSGNANGGQIGDGNYLGTLYATCLECGAEAFQDCFLDQETTGVVA